MTSKIRYVVLAMAATSVVAGTAYWAGSVVTEHNERCASSSAAAAECGVPDRPPDLP